MNEVGMYKQKQDWLDRVMASKLTHAEKTYAYCIFKRMYGTKVVAFPDTAQIMRDGGFVSSGHFQEYRNRLVTSGALLADLDYHTKSSNTPNYEYTLVLDWDGAVALKGEAAALGGKSGSTSRQSGSTRGASNTINNTSKDTPTKTLEDNVPELADAPSVTFNRIALGDRFTYTMKDVTSSPNQEAAAPVYLVDLTAVTKSSAVAPQVPPHDDDEEASKGKKYLELLLRKNLANPASKAEARRRYSDRCYEPGLRLGLGRAATVVRNIKQPLAAPTDFGSAMSDAGRESNTRRMEV